MAEPENVNIFPDEIEGGTTEFSDGSVYYGVRFIDLKQDKCATVLFTPESISRAASQIAALMNSASGKSPH
jgi:hypothetical protein